MVSISEIVNSFAMVKVKGRLYTSILRVPFAFVMMMIAFITINSGLVRLMSQILYFRFKVGLGISRTNADSQWNPVYNAFHLFLLLWKRNESLVVL